MKSTAQSVDQYLKEIPSERIEVLTKLRQLCTKVLAGYDEGMNYNMPSYKRNEAVEVAFASQKKHICIYILKHDVMLNNADLLKNINHGKGCIRFGKPEKIDFNLIEKLLIETVASNAPIC